MSKFEHNGKKIPKAPPKDPNDEISYGCDWSPDLAMGEVITASSWIITPSGLTQVATAFTDTGTSVLLSGGAIGTTYLATNRVTTGFRTEDRSMHILCVDK